MKKLLFILALLVTLQVPAQKLIGGKNIIKGNLTSFALRNYHFSYERSLNHFMSVSASYRYMPKEVCLYNQSQKNTLIIRPLILIYSKWEIML